MTLFAEHTPKPRRGASALEPVSIRAAVMDDVPVLARIASDRHGDDPERHRAKFERILREEVDAGDGLLLVAIFHGEIVGYGGTSRFRDGESIVLASLESLAPEGWYLSGVIVRPEWRRKGVADTLTAKRLEWIAQRASHAYYFANTRNRVSIDLHHRFGFVEISRDFVFPGVSFTGGEGILFQVDLTRDAEPNG
jgi:ribosomal protein S18 acetylase RimI-like enzyme